MSDSLPPLLTAISDFTIAYTALPSSKKTADLKTSISIFQAAQSREVEQKAMTDFSDDRFDSKLAIYMLKGLAAALEAYLAATDIAPSTRTQIPLDMNLIHPEGGGERSPHPKFQERNTLQNLVFQQWATYLQFAFLLRAKTGAHLLI